MLGPILITGGAGFVGSHLIDLLGGEGADLVAWRRPGGINPAVNAPAADAPLPGARPPASGVSRTSSALRWQAIDLLDSAQVHRALAELRPAAVYHCAGAAHVGRSWDSATNTLAINVRGTHNLLEGLRRAGVSAKIVIPSSAMVYAGANALLKEDDPIVPRSPYALSKLAQEMVGQHAIGDGLHVTIARAFNHLGPRQNPFFAASGFARRIADIEAGRWEPEIAVGNLEARRDFTDVRDTIRAYRLILERGTRGRAYNVCSGHAITIRELLDRLLARARVPIRVRVDPARYRPNDTPLLVGDPARIQTELGWRPDISLDRTLDDLLDDWRSRPVGSVGNIGKIGPVI
jgi:GDP-4-dehydro-6-deoxy-D-mannose reductase